jgi:hypothetical protein
VATIYVRLLRESIDVWRPVEAESVSDAFRIVTPRPGDEQWEFQPGDVVRCEKKMLTRGGPPEPRATLVAIERASAGA